MSQPTFELFVWKFDDVSYMQVLCGSWHSVINKCVGIADVILKMSK